MDNGLYQAAGAMRSSERRLETIAHNLANVSTRGYKRETSFAHAIQSTRAKETQVTAGVAPDFTQGPLENTSHPLDLALDGPGFFVVEDSGGRTYTRDGSFRLDERGTLVTQDGQSVAWKGARGSLRPTGRGVTVDATGQVRQGDALIGQLDVVDVAQPTELTPSAAGRWSAPPGTQEIPAKAQVRQGAVERSNVEAMDELVALVNVQRGFESASTMLRSIEQSYTRLNQPR
jgi:flagellar basal body rod protein FlgG